tara:strand:+ start:830 stop:1438 length:609 start_codon:yes stop_codon:yes gene_type:complete
MDIDQFEDFDEAFAHTPVDAEPDGGTPQIRRRRESQEWLTFWSANAIILPLVAMIYASVISEGLRQIMPIFQMRLYRMPVPGAGMIRQWDGWDRVDLAFVMSLLLFALVAWLWCRIFIEAQGLGRIAKQRQQNPFVFYMLTTFAVVLIGGDALIFYVGISAQSESDWNETPAYVAPLATVLYSCGLAVLGWWHSDYHTSNIV